MAETELAGLPASRSTRIIEAVAEREGVDPTELREPLYGAIDPDALDALLASGDVRVTFTYHGYQVTVSGDHPVQVEPHIGS